MSSSIKVADLFAALALKIEPGTLARVDAFLNDAEGKTKKSSSKIGKHLSKAFGDLRAKIAPAVAAGIAGIGYAAVRGAQDALKFNEAVTTLKIASNGVIGTTDEMTRRFLDLSKSSGIAKEELVAAAQTYFDLTGDAKGTAEALEVFARVAKASATPMQDVAGAAFVMRQQFGIMPSDMEKAFSILIRGGKEGAVSLANMASLTGSMGAMFKVFGNSDGLEGAATMSALFQALRKDAGSAAEAATNLENLFAKIVSRKGELAKIGVRVEDGKLGSNKYKDIITIIKLLKGARDKDFSAFKDAFGADIQATKALDSASSQLGLIDELIQKTREADDVQKDLAERNASQSERAAKAMNAFKVSMVEAFTPERIEKFVAALQVALSAVTAIVQTISDLVDEVERLSGDNDQDLASAAVFKAAETAALQKGMTPVQAKKEGRAAVARQGRGQINRGGVQEDQGLLSADWGWEGIKTRARFASGFIGGGLIGLTGDKFLLGDGEIAAGNRKQSSGSYAAPTTITSHVNLSALTNSSPEEIARTVGRALEEFWNGKLRHALGGSR